MANRKKDQTNKAKRRVGRTISLKKPPPLKAPIAPLKPQKQTRVLPFVKRAITWFFVLLSGIVAVLYFYPRVSIQETTLLQPDNPFYFPFIIKNTGNIPITNFTYVMSISDMLYGRETHFQNVLISGFNDTIHKIKVNGSQPIDISNNLSRIFPEPYNDIKTVQIFIHYKYLIPIFNITLVDSTKFVLKKDVNKGYHWKEYQY